MKTQDIIFLSLLASFQLIYYIGLWRVFEKAGEKGWKAIIPFYNDITILKLIGKKWYNVFYLLIPGINIVFFLFGMLFDLYRSFGKEKFGEQVLGIFFYPFFISYLGFSPKEKYLGPAEELPKTKKTVQREWADAILFAVVAATIIRWVLLEAYKIPTPSMEKTLLMGDYLFVSKVHYGPRTPMTPLQVPLTHQTWWWSDKSKSYLDWIQLPQYRLPGLTNVKNNDVVVFNWPADAEHKPVDLKTNYIKRCIAIGGDTLMIQNRNVFINGKYVPNPPQSQFRFKLYTKNQLSRKFFRKYDIPNWGDYEHRYPSYFNPLAPNDSEVGYAVEVTPEIAEKIKNSGEVDSVAITSSMDLAQRETTFPYSTKYSNGWNIDNYGPLWIPKKGVTISMNEKNVEFYGSTIQNYEGQKNVKVENNKLYIDGKEVKEYTFQNQYYFMMGDNRHNSLDSRFWGFVPENYVVGKALFIWFSKDPDPGKNSGGIRWKRVFNGIK
jgi:signal peptidase I